MQAQASRRRSPPPPARPASCGPCRRAARPSSSRASPPGRRRAASCPSVSPPSSASSLVAKHEERIGEVLVDLALVAPDAAAECGARQVVGRPDRLPRRAGNRGSPRGAWPRPRSRRAGAGAADSPRPRTVGGIVGCQGEPEEGHRRSARELGLRDDDGRRADAREPRWLATGPASSIFFTGPTAAIVGGVSSMASADAADILDGDRVDRRHDLLARHHAAEGEHVARHLLGAARASYSSPISSETLICALARATSASFGARPRRARIQHDRHRTRATSFSPVPA